MTTHQSLKYIRLIFQEMIDTRRLDNRMSKKVNKLSYKTHEKIKFLHVFYIVKKKTPNMKYTFFTVWLVSGVSLIHTK